MADVIKNESSLHLVAGFVDGDTRTITMYNPKSKITAAEINDINESAKKVLIGDKNGATFAAFKEANVIESSVTYIDLELGR